MLPVSEWGEQHSSNPPFSEESRWLLSTVGDVGTQRNTDAEGTGRRWQTRGKWKLLPFYFRQPFHASNSLSSIDGSESVSHSIVSNSATPWTRSSLPGSSVHGIFQTRILEWIVISFSKESSWPRDRTWISCIAGRLFTIWATREALM